MIDPKSGFCSVTKIYHSLLPPAPLPPENEPLSISHYIFSLFHTTTTTSSFSPGITSSTNTTTASVIDSETGDRVSYSEFINHVESLAFSLKSQIGLSKGDTAFILSPTSTHIPILYFSLLSLGVVISPSNPTNTISEISHQFNLCKPAIAFATSKTAHKIPSILRYPTILLDSSDFHSMMKKKISSNTNRKLDSVAIHHSDTAAILYSSGTTGRVKGVILTHRNLMSVIAELYAFQSSISSNNQMVSGAVSHCMVPLFHIYGIISILRSVAMGETLVITTKRFDVGRMMKAIGEFKVTDLAVAPPVILAMTNEGSSDNVMLGMGRYDLSSLDSVICGGAPLSRDLVARFGKQFPNVALRQGYGITEATGGVFRRADSFDIHRFGSTGQLVANFQVKIVDPETGVALPPCKQGELWVKGPAVMKGYIGEEKATSTTLDSDGWLRTGDLCYIDNDGFLFVIDRLKELIKYKGYQVPPAELEELLQSHPDILDAAVIPYPNDETGEVPMAFVVRRSQSSLDKSEVMDFIAKQVAPYKKIRKVAFVDSIPKNAPGKIMRRELIKLALSCRLPNAKL